MGLSLKKWGSNLIIKMGMRLKLNLKHDKGHMMEYTVTKEVRTTETLTREVKLCPTITGFLITINGESIIHCNEGDGGAYVFQEFYDYFPTIEDRDQKMRKRGEQ